MPKNKAVVKNGFNPVKSKRLFEIVADQIREAILAGQYVSGDRLSSEKELCQSFQVGRPVIREALRTLENSGTLTIRPGAGGGIFIKKLDSDQLMNSLETIVQLDRVTIQQITEARLTIEKSVWSLARKRIQPEDIARLEENIALARECLAKKSPEPINLGFHIILAEASGNPLLVMITKALLDVLQKYLSQLGLSLKRKERALEIHALMLDQIKKGHWKEAMAIMEADLTKLAAGQPSRKALLLSGRTKTKSPKGKRTGGSPAKKLRSG